MQIEKVKFTPKALKLIKYADTIARGNNFNAIHPVHLFLAALKFDDEINMELKTLVSLNGKAIEENLNKSIIEKYFSEYGEIKVEDAVSINISLLTKDIILESKRITELYEEHGQIFISDGQILKAVLNSEDEVTKNCLKELDKDLVISIIASPRDMIVDLNKEFTIDYIEDIYIGKVTDNDREIVREFVLKRFYERWTKTIDYGLTLEEIPIYIALHNDNIVGFAGYDISRQRKGYFGPLGVLRAYRNRNIGQALVKACLIDMKELGYENCIIGNAGSIEFYEKACDARIIPILSNDIRLT